MDMSGFSIDEGCSNENFGRFGVDRVAVGAQASHSGGSAMSQRECSGLNGPPAPIPAEEPVRITPDAIRRAGPGRVGNFDHSLSSTILRLASVLPAAL